MSGVATPDLLAAIVAATRKAVAWRQRMRPLDTLMTTAERMPRGEAFIQALRNTPHPRIIAECKRRSPSRGILRRSYDPADHARAYASAGAAAVSVLTEPTFFDGAPEHLTAVRQVVGIPILRKDFIVTDYQIHEAAVLGADAVLLIVSALEDGELARLLRVAASLSLAALVEVHDGEELRRAVAAGADVIGVNSRNLRTLSVDRRVLETVVHDMPASAIAVAESGVRSGEDIRELSACGYNAFLIGEHLITAPDPGAALATLRMSCA